MEFIERWIEIKFEGFENKNVCKDSTKRKKTQCIFIAYKLQKFQIETLRCMTQLASIDLVHYGVKNIHNSKLIVQLQSKLKLVTL